MSSLPVGRGGRWSPVFVGLLFFVGPPVFLGFAVSLRTTERIDARHVVADRMRGFVDAARTASMRRGVELSLLLAVASVESAGRPAARSGAGAVGLMQLMPATARQLAAEEGRGPADLTDPASSLDIGAKYLAEQIATFEDRAAGLELALCAYNAGPGAVRRWLVEDPLDATAETLGTWIPYGETRAFVRRVREWREHWEIALAPREPGMSDR